MRKKRKKIIRIRRNPFSDSDQIPLQEFMMLFLRGRENDLSALINYYHQDYMCHDCDKNYSKCKCEKCEYCFKGRCLCLLEEIGINDIKPSGRVKIRKIMWEFARFYYNSENLNHLLTLIKHYSPTAESPSFMKSLTSSSKFPKYTPLMKRLFEID